jgi:hypothetical protein
MVEVLCSFFFSFEGKVILFEGKVTTGKELKRNSMIIHQNKKS